MSSDMHIVLIFKVLNLIIAYTYIYKRARVDN